MRRVAFGATGEKIFFVPGEHRMAHAKIVEPIKSFEAVADRRQSFSASENVKFTGCFRCFDLCKTVHEHSIRAFCQLLAGGLHHLCNARCWLLVVGRIRPENEAPAFDTAAAEFGQKFLRQDVPLTIQATLEHACENIGMSIKNQCHFLLS